VFPDISTESNSSNISQPVVPFIGIGEDDRGFADLCSGIHGGALVVREARGRFENE